MPLVSWPPSDLKSCVLFFRRAAYEEDDVLIGPPPPALVAEADDAPEKERFDEVRSLVPRA